MKNSSNVISLSKLVDILEYKQNSGEITVNLSHRQGYELGLKEAVEVAKALAITYIWKKCGECNGMGTGLMMDDRGKRHHAVCPFCKGKGKV